MTRRNNDCLLFLLVVTAALTQYPAEFSLVLTVLMLSFEKSLVLAFQQVVLPIIGKIVAWIFLTSIIFWVVDIGRARAFALLSNDRSEGRTITPPEEDISPSGFHAPSPPELNRPTEGETNWHEPLNENFDRIEQFVSRLASRLDASVTADYNQPQEGTHDWHVLLNDNFEKINRDIHRLAREAGVSGVGGYSHPQKGAADWHIPLNNNFHKIQHDLQRLAESV